MKPIEFCATSVDCVITTVLLRSVTDDYSAFARPFEDGGRDFKGQGEDTLIVGRATFHCTWCKSKQY